MAQKKYLIGHCSPKEDGNGLVKMKGYIVGEDLMNALVMLKETEGLSDVNERMNDKMASVLISEKREPDKNGNTHFIFLQPVFKKEEVENETEEKEKKVEKKGDDGFDDLGLGDVTF